MRDSLFNIQSGATPEEIRRNREEIARIFGDAGRARYVGEGLANAAASIAAGIAGRRANRFEREGRESANDLFERIISGASGGGGMVPTLSSSGTTGGGTRTFGRAPSSPPLLRNTSGAASAIYGTSAPTAGLRYMLPASDPDAGDPRRGQFATPAPRVNDPTVYTTDMSGALEGVDQGIIDLVGNSVEQAYGPGAAVVVSSGYRPGSRGSQHSAGQALDFSVTDADGQRSDWQDPRIFDTARVAAGDGASGIGIGQNYMGGDTFHMDTGQGGGNGAPNFGDTVRTWSDWNTGANLAQNGRGNADRGGAGDPAYGLQQELQGIRDGRSIQAGALPDTGGAVANFGSAPAPQSGMEQYRNAIAAVESDGSGGYAAIGPRHRTLGSPLGRYQIMEANLPEWSRAALGREVTADEFMANPAIQDAIFDHRFGGYVERYGPDRAARAWFSGEGGMNNMGAADSLGTSNAEYTRRFNAALGQQSVSGGGVNRDISGGAGADGLNTSTRPQGMPPIRNQSAPAGQPSMQELYQLSANPWLNQEQRAVVNSMIAQQQQANDPLRQLQIQRAQLEMQQMQNPSPQMEIMQLGDGRQYYVDPMGVQPPRLVAPDLNMPAGGMNAGVRSSEILADGTIIQSTDQGPRIYSPSGELLEGQAAVEAVTAARAFDVENQRSIYGGRREGTLGADIEMGGAAAQTEALGQATAQAATDAWASYGQLQSSIGNMDEAIAAIDAGAQSGAVYNRLPRFDEEGARLQNAMDRMGLDVVGSVTFGALSEGELRLAMSTAVPRNLNEQDLRAWLVRRRDAQIATSNMLADAAQFLSTPGNTINGWIERNREGAGRPPADAPPEETAASGPPPAASQAMDFSQMDANGLSGVDVGSLNADQLNAYLSRVDEVLQ